MSYKSNITKIKNDLQEIKAKLDKENSIDLSKMTDEELEQMWVELAFGCNEKEKEAYLSLSDEEKDKFRREYCDAIKEKLQDEI